MGNGSRIQRRRSRGFVLVTAGIMLLVLVGALGLVFDLGRLYIFKSEAQTWADSAAIRAALCLDGTRNGLTLAATSALSTPGKWGFSSTAFTTGTAVFSTSPNGPWANAATAPLLSIYARVNVTVPARLMFLPALVSTQVADVAARSTAAQVAKNTFTEGLFPFSPYAHNSTGPNFGLDSGTLYTLRWPANPKLGNGSNICSGDRIEAVKSLADAAGGSERGYIEDTSASLIATTIIDDYQSITRTVGDLVNMTGGAKQSQLNSLQTRISQDSDTTSMTYAEYVAGNRGNGRRIVAVPINDGGTPAGMNNRIVGIGSFFLYPTGEYGTGGGQAWCAEYIGSWVQGTNHHGVLGGGAYVVRLTE